MLHRGASNKKWAALVCLVLLQSTSGLVFKLSQKSSQYTYSPSSALVVSEAVKLGISLALHVSGSRDSEKAPSDSAGTLHWAGSLEILLLSAMYSLNNQIAFHLFLKADPASVIIFSSSSSFIVASMRSFLMKQSLSGDQWRAIVLQICGLIVSQYNPCTASGVLAGTTYAVLSASVIISALNSVWNESQLKRIPVSMHVQNMLMYAGGFAYNLAGHYLESGRQPGTGFFAGFTAATAGVILVNACSGIVITAIYKYANAVVKSFALSVTTVTVMLLSWALFGVALNPVNLSGCIVIAVSVYSYNLSTAATK